MIAIRVFSIGVFFLLWFRGDGDEEEEDDDDDDDDEDDDDDHDHDHDHDDDDDHQFTCRASAAKWPRNASISTSKRITKEPTQNGRSKSRDAVAACLFLRLYI